MKTKHILAVLSTCLVAVSFSPINFFSQAAPPPGFTMFDGKEFQFDVPDTTPGVWLPAFTCPVGGNMKITDGVLYYGMPGDVLMNYGRLELRITRSSTSQVIYSAFRKDGYYFTPYAPNLYLSAGDIVEYRLNNGSSVYDSACIMGLID